jgi:protein tyrosine/serine phosphatase
MMVEKNQGWNYQMKENRILNWDGCKNVRDLGGLKTEDGRRVRWGALVRSDDPSNLSAEGWKALYAHGIRMIISLRTDGMEETELELPEGFDELEVMLAPVEDLGDEEFLEVWAKSDLWCTPLYYQDAIKRWPERHAAVFAAIAGAQEGGVLFHCKRGVDRTGIISMMVLALLGVPDEEIVKDYVLSLDPERDQILREMDTTSEEVILDTLKDLDMEVYLLDAGMSQAEIDQIRDRVLEMV